MLLSPALVPKTRGTRSGGLTLKSNIYRALEWSKLALKCFIKFKIFKILGQILYWAKNILLFPWNPEWWPLFSWMNGCDVMMREWVSDGRWWLARGIPGLVRPAFILLMMMSRIKIILYKVKMSLSILYLTDNFWQFLLRWHFATDKVSICLVSAMMISPLRLCLAPAREWARLSQSPNIRLWSLSGSRNHITNTSNEVFCQFAKNILRVKAKII